MNDEQKGALSHRKETIRVRQLEGTCRELYRLVAPLVMNPVVIKQNLGYPFRTGEKFIWYVAQGRRNEVLGFIPLELKPSGYVINNYYAKNHREDVLRTLLQSVIEGVDHQKALYSLTITNDAAVFADMGFTTVKVLTNYVKMKHA